MKTKLKIVVTENHEYFVGDIRLVSVTQILRGVGAYGDAVNFYTEEGKLRGKHVHRILEYHLKGKLDEVSVDERLKGYYAAWKKFEQENEVVIEAIEEPIYDINLELAGTPDIIGKVNGRKTILDIKTGAPSPATNLQLAGYKMILGTEGLLYKRAALHLKNNGSYSYMPCVYEKIDNDVFKSCYIFYNWKEENKLLTSKGE